MNKKIVTYIVGLIFLLILSLLLLAFLSGRVSRIYEVLPPGSEVVIDNETYSLIEIVEKYTPIIKIKSQNYTLPLLEIKYNIVENGNMLDIIYYLVWEDEVHPNRFINNIYWLFRAVYYGYPVRDIEYLQVSINTISGDIQQILFETSPGNDYNVIYSEHVIARYQQITETDFLETLTKKTDGQIISIQNRSVDIIDTRILLGIVTWNHLSRLISRDDIDYDYQLTAELSYLTDNEYRNGKYVRKSQGDYRTKENLSSWFFGTLFSVLFFIFSGLLFYRWVFAKKGRNNERK